MSDYVVKPKKRRKRKLKKWVRDLLKTVCITGIAFVTLSTVVKPVEIKGESMEPTYHNGEIGFMNIVSYKIFGVERDDIAIIHIDDEEGERYIVKRIVATPGDLIQYSDGKLYINHKLVQDVEVKNYDTGEPYLVKEFKLKNGEYYCLGDNYDNSKDSRYYGPFKEEQIVGKNPIVFGG